MAGSKRAAHPQRRAALYPALAEAAKRTRTDAVGLIDLTTREVDDLATVRAAITYSWAGRSENVLTDAPTARAMRAPTGNGPVASWPGGDGEILSLSCELKTSPALPRSVPAFESYDHVALSVALDSREEGLVRACAAVKAGATPVVMTTWTLSSLRPERRDRLVQLLAQAATQRRVVWVSVEGVGVAPRVATLGDRRASGHSLIGLVVFNPRSVKAETVGRCWSGGRYLAWFGS